MPNEPLPFTFVVVAVCGGNVEYYDTQDYEQFEDLRGGNENNSDHEIYQRKLPQEIISYLYNVAISQTEESKYDIKTNENKEYKTNTNMAKKQVIRLTESDLHRIIKESVNNILSELDWKTYANAAKRASIKGDTRTSKFRDAAINKFNKEYVYENLKSDTGVKNLKAVPANDSDWEVWRKKEIIHPH